MKRVPWRISAGLTAALFLAGCDATASYQAVYKEKIQTMEAELAILKQITDDETMEKFLPELRKLRWQSLAIKKKFEELPKLSEEAKRDVEVEFVAPIQYVANELQREYVRINNLPGGDVFLQRVKKL